MLRKHLFTNAAFYAEIAFCLSVILIAMLLFDQLLTSQQKMRTIMIAFLSTTTQLQNIYVFNNKSQPQL